jgi:hypothetical protein
MAYQTGTASSTSNLLDTLRGFLAANGWTVTWRFQIAQSTWRWLHASKGGVFFNAYEWLVAASATLSPSPHIIFCNYATAYNASLDPYAQPGRNLDSGATGITPPYLSYHFFEGVGASGPYCYVAIEIGAGEFAHFGFGVLNKAGTYTGGEFACGSMWLTTNGFGGGQQNNALSSGNAWPFSDNASINAWITNLPIGTIIRCVPALSGSHVVASQGSLTGQQLRCGGARNHSTTRSDAGTAQWLLWQAPTIPSIATAVLMAPHCFAERTTNNYSYIGVPPGLRHVSLEFLNPGDEIVLGAETWKVFPLRRKGSGSEIPLSGNYGIAYLKN